MTTEAGIKLDSGKTRVGLMVSDFPNALEKIAEVSTFGAIKYTDHGWLTVPNGIPRYTDALYRHLLAYSKGELTDPESNLPHLAHAAWCILAVLQLELKNMIHVRCPRCGKKYDVSGGYQNTWVKENGQWVCPDHAPKKLELPLEESPPDMSWLNQ